MLTRILFFCVAFFASQLALSQQCVPYARQETGIQIYGDAYTWWGQAPGQGYKTGSTPEINSVLSFPQWTGNPFGHVAVVRMIVDDDEILIDHANWNLDEKVQTGVKVKDVSGNWTKVKIHNGISYSATEYRTNGFIYDTFVTDCIKTVPWANTCDPTKIDNYLECRDTNLCSMNELGGSSIDRYNLKLDFDIFDSTGMVEWLAGVHALRVHDVVKLRVELQAEHGDTVPHMVSGRDTVESDFYYRIGLGSWIFIGRQYTKATNLPKDNPHAESIYFTIPDTGGQEISFRVEIDPQDEVVEANEGDNRSRIEIFSVTSDPPTVNLVVPFIDLASVSQPVPAGGLMGAVMDIQNIGNSIPPTGTRSAYKVCGPLPSTACWIIADDGSDAADLVPGRLQREEINSLVQAPTTPGSYLLCGVANYQGALVETSSNDNETCKQFTVAVIYPNLVIERFEDRIGCCTTNRGKLIEPRVWVRNNGAQPTANLLVGYWIKSPVATGNNYLFIGYGTIEPRELPPGSVDEDKMDAGGWMIPKTSAWNKQWHTVRACVHPQGLTPVGDESVESCRAYARYSKE